MLSLLGLSSISGWGTKILQADGVQQPHAPATKQYESLGLGMTAAPAVQQQQKQLQQHCIRHQAQVHEITRLSQSSPMPFPSVRERS